MESFKVPLMANGFAQKKWIDYNECQWHFMIWVTSDESKDCIPQWDLYKNDYMA
jgi:hypothetical protein